MNKETEFHLRKNCLLFKFGTHQKIRLLLSFGTHQVSPLNQQFKVRGSQFFKHPQSISITNQHFLLSILLFTIQVQTNSLQIIFFVIKFHFTNLKFILNIHFASIQV